MARVKGALQVTGGIKGVSFYTIKGSDTVFMRTKGGPSAGRMKTGKEFANVRLHQTEWGGCVLFSQFIKNSLPLISELADFNISPTLNGLGKKLMKLDTEHETGQRSIELSKYPEALTGFNLNKQFQFGAVFRNSIQIDTNKQNGRVRFDIPRINATEDILNIQKLPYFRLVFCLSYVADVEFNPNASYGCRYHSRNFSEPYLGAADPTEWFATNDILEAQSKEISIDLHLTEAQMAFTTCMVSVGIQFGTTALGNRIERVKNAGCARIVVLK